ncbi:glutaredoxin [Metallosphaera tengchongensis]|uniref:Glutaredoxin n=1 Tax=Metallosphaera tengchongensis TaxID=1532350 RepID=A0A6N0NQS8_9CREN|nr:thioredoxin family protein [Metallosphaera tengchongensis]QKQ99223.1 glutaredoxin [Metallosphaera tengchongensis]
MSYDYIIKQYIKMIKDVKVRHCKATEFLSQLQGASIQIEEDNNCNNPELHVYAAGRKYFSYYGIPAVNELWPFLNALVRASTGVVQLDQQELEMAKKIRGNIKLFVTQDCTKCPIAAELLYQVALVNQNVTLEVIDSEMYDSLAKQFHVMNVPKIVLNEKTEIPGGFPPNIVLKMLMKSSNQE